MIFLDTNMLKLSDYLGLIGILCECKVILKCNHVQSSDRKKWKCLWWISLTFWLKPHSKLIYLILLCFIDKCYVLIWYAMYAPYTISELFNVANLKSVNICYILYVIDTSYSMLSVSYCSQSFWAIFLLQIIIYLVFLIWNWL